jgi:hypothetical protein
MKIKTTVTFEYRLEDKEIERFKAKVLEYIQEESELNITLDDIPDELVKDYLKDSLPDIIEEYHLGYCNVEGVEIDGYFNTIGFDYYGEDARNLVQEIAEQIIVDMEEE